MARLPMSLMRSVLLYAAGSKWLQTQAPRRKFVRRAVSRFLPGESLDDAFAAAENLGARKIRSVFTQLGENVRSKEEAAVVSAHYLAVLERIREHKIEAEISVKLTHLGLDLDNDLCFENLLPLLPRATEGTVVWIDMEGSAYTERTLEMFFRARAQHKSIGICIQAYLYRSASDLDRLIESGAAVRLVKGAYREPPEIAFPRKRDLDRNFFSLAQKLLSASERGVRAAIATHDRTMIADLCHWAEHEGISRSKLEFQMLYGIQRGEQLRLASEGYDSRVLIAYGTEWYAWYMRRLAERPANLWFVARNLF